MFPVIRSEYSLLFGLASPAKIVAQAKSLGYNTLTLIDKNSLSGHIQFLEACEKHDVKPILGCELEISDVSSNSPVIFIAKNKDGWKALCRIISSENKPSIPEIRDKTSNNYKDIICVTTNSDLTSKLKSVFNCGDVYYIPNYREVCYLSTEDRTLHQILLATKEKKTLLDFRHKEYKWKKYFEKDYDLPNVESISYPESLLNSIEAYEGIRRPVTLPNFCENPVEELKRRCRIGWENLIKNKVDNIEEYKKRARYELDVICQAGLANYFLIVKDIIDFVVKNGKLCGPGRGSVGGSLIAYLLGITKADPIEYNLFFERFLNPGRLAGKDSTMPDIDLDVPKFFRPKIIEYLQEKYGKNKVGHISTFVSLKGRGALKAVLRAGGTLTETEINSITNNIIEEARISDDLAIMEEEEGHASIIKWCLEHTPQKLKSWCYLLDNELQGPLAKEFEQAIRLEGTKIIQSKHASGIVVMPGEISEIAPSMRDNEEGVQIISLDMYDVEKIGGIKFDILGNTLIDKLLAISSQIRSEKCQKKSLEFCH